MMDPKIVSPGEVYALYMAQVGLTWGEILGSIHAALNVAVTEPEAVKNLMAGQAVWVLWSPANIPAILEVIDAWRANGWYIAYDATQAVFEIHLQDAMRSGWMPSATGSQMTTGQNGMTELQ